MKYLTLLIFTLISAELLGCSCDPPEVQEAYKESKTILVGKIIGEEVFSEDYILEDTNETEEVEEVLGVNGLLIEVTEVLKGKVKSKVFWVLSSRMSCGPSMKIGTTYLMYLRKSKRMKSISSNNNARLITGYCYGTKNVIANKAKLELDYLRN